MTEYGVIVTMKLLGTAEKFQMIRQLKLLDQILGSNNIFIRATKRLITIPIIKLCVNLTSIPFLTIGPSLQKAELAKNMLGSHIKRIQKRLRNFLNFNGLPCNGLRFQHKVFIALVDKREHLMYLIRSHLIRQGRARAWFNEDFISMDSEYQSKIRHHNLIIPDDEERRG